MIRLHDYWRSGAGYRVRIALNLKKLGYQRVTHDLRTGAQRSADYLALNPQGLVPTLEMDEQSITQSLAIIEWLDERFPSPALLPEGADARAIVRAMAMIVCADIHPLNNLRVLNALREDFSADATAVDRWTGRWIGDGLATLETMIGQYGGGFAYGDTPTIADCCLIPQVYSAHRFGIEMTHYPNINTVCARCDELPAFASARPDVQADAG